jgi:hypothetical protein
MTTNGANDGADVSNTAFFYGGFCCVSSSKLVTTHYADIIIGTLVRYGRLHDMEGSSPAKTILTTTTDGS